MNQLEISMEAAFAIEFASNESLQGIARLSSRELVYMTWCLGYSSGLNDAFKRVQAMFPAEAQ